jgi:hypothetical protein
MGTADGEAYQLREPLKTGKIRYLFVFYKYRGHKKTF